MSAHGTLLCIDDDPACLKVRKLLMESFGYQVCTANSGREGINLFHSQQFDAVLVDYQMPGMNGVQVATELRRLNPATPILMLSAYNSLPESVTRFVNAFVSKTEPAKHIATKVEQLIAANAQGAAQPLWFLAAAVGTAAFAGLALQRRWRQAKRDSGGASEAMC